MLFRNRSIGVLSAFDRHGGDGSFSDEDERLLQAFAASAATAVATAQTASNQALQRSVQASEQERKRWARELHDETLQELAGLRVLLSSARRSSDAARLDGAVDQAIELLTQGISRLRELITELRPASLDELGT
jgi:signal transduction histidine kinase